MFHRHAADDCDEAYGLEHRFPVGWFLAGLFGAADVAATVLTLLAQA
jgi:hypothetical protein